MLVEDGGPESGLEAVPKLGHAQTLVQALNCVIDATAASPVHLHVDSTRLGSTLNLAVQVVYRRLLHELDD